MRIKIKEEEKSPYWAEVAISCGQVFFGISVVTLFAGKFDLIQLLVILSSLVLSIICWIIGRRVQ